jgi:hypothetical protein
MKQKKKEVFLLLAELSEPSMGSFRKWRIRGV